MTIEEYEHWICQVHLVSFLLLCTRVCTNVQQCKQRAK